jgi:tetratricopeptide (TPR) repeat protein
MVQAPMAAPAAVGMRGGGQILIDRRQCLKQGRISEQRGVQRSLQEGMAKVGRNDPCPCGSGHKYKRCCLPRDEAAAVAARAAAPAGAVDAAPPPPFELVSDDDGLDDASNVVIDLIDAGRLDDAERAAQDLLERYPEVHDGLERVAMVAAARGDRTRAAEYYRRAADFVHSRPDCYDAEMETYFREKVAEFSRPNE